MQDSVLIIEDTRSFALLLKQLIVDALQLDCDSAYTMKEAEELLEKNKGRYFAAIVDLNLPDAPRGEATDLVVSHNIPAVVFTSTNDQSLKDDLWDRGISDYAHKSGAYSLDYIVWIINRLKNNDSVDVLIVDESLLARKVMTRLLKTQRLNVHIAQSGQEALEHLDRRPEIKVAIIDCSMQDTPAFELVAKVREKHSSQSLEIIGISSHTNRALSAQFIKSGGNDVLIKPFIPEEFLCRVNRAIERIENFNELKTLNATKNQILSTAAHDIRGPIGAIKTTADYLLKRDPKPERRERLLNMIEASSESLLCLLEDLLDASSIESGEIQLKLSNTDICKVVSERVNLYSPQAEAKEMNIQLQRPKAFKFDIDEVKIRQVIDNLLTNAIKYSPPGSGINVNVIESTSGLTIEVIDSGPGIKEEEREDLFKAFKVLSTQPTGGETATGLGLAIANNIVKAHGGSLNYKDADTQGSCFSICIPSS